MRKKYLAFVLAVAVTALLFTGCSGIEDVPALFASKILSMYDEEHLDTEPSSEVEATDAGSAQTEAPQTESSQTETAQTEAPQTEAVQVAEASLPFTVEDQLALILEYRGMWSDDEELFSTYYSYTVTDLDRNGRLEILFGSCVGTGYFTYMGIWEVNEDCSALVAVERSYSEDYSQADLICDEAKVFYDSSRNVYTYIFTDYSRNGWMWNGTDVRTFCLKNGLVSETSLCSRSCETDENYESHESYFSADGAEITPEEYESMADKVFAGRIPMNATFYWNSLSDEDLWAMSDGDMLTSLREAYEGFSVD